MVDIHMEMKCKLAFVEYGPFMVKALCEPQGYIV